MAVRIPKNALLKYVRSMETSFFALGLLIRFLATGHFMKSSGSIRVCWSVFLALACLASACAETIHLKNGRTIYADSVREANGRVEYTIGDNTFSISKASVLSIAAGGPPTVPPVADLPMPNQPDLNIHNQDELTA